MGDAQPSWLTCLFSRPQLFHHFLIKTFLHSCSSLALAVLKMSMIPDIEAQPGVLSVSQSLNVIYHSPAALYVPHISWLVQLVAHLILQGGQNSSGKYHLEYWSESSICTDWGTWASDPMSTSMPHYESLPDLERNSPSSGGVWGTPQNGTISAKS